MQKISITYRVENGKLKGDKKLFNEAVAQHDGKKVTITIERAKNKRTNAQNRWYWGVAVQMVKSRLRELGTILDSDSAHELIKLAISQIDSELMTEVKELPNGESITRIRSTTELTTTHFMAYKDLIQHWAVEVLDISIPDPNEQQELTFN